jgi:hypothetical protein
MAYIAGASQRLACSESRGNVPFTSRWLFGIALLGCAIGAGAAPGDIPLNPALQDKFFFALGAFFPQTNTQAQLISNATGIGTTVDFEESLDMPRQKTVPTFIARWRINNRWRLDAEYFELNRASVRTIDREINWGDQTFPVNAQVASEFDFADLRVSIGYSFFKRPDKELGVGLGFHVATYDVGLSGANIGSQEEDVLAPLPVLSLYGQFALTERWSLGMRLDRFSLSYDKFDGSLTSLGLDLLYQPFRTVGFGLGYRALAIRADVEGDRATLKMRQTFEGPMVFMTVSF